MVREDTIIFLTRFNPTILVIFLIFGFLGSFYSDAFGAEGNQNWTLWISSTQMAFSNKWLALWDQFFWI